MCALGNWLGAMHRAAFGGRCIGAAIVAVRWGGYWELCALAAAGRCALNGRLELVLCHEAAEWCLVHVCQTRVLERSQSSFGAVGAAFSKPGIEFPNNRRTASELLSALLVN